jgi:hypothetical protein
MIIEDFNFWQGDFNWYWHTVDDRIEFFNFQYFHKLSKLTTGTLTYLAFNVGVSDIKSSDLISEFIIHQNFPNPFNPTTTIKYHIPELCFVTINIYDVLGNEITTLVNEERPAGAYTIQFDSNGLSSGTYFYRIKAGSFIKTKKMVLLR